MEPPPLAPNIDAHAIITFQHTNQKLSPDDQTTGEAVQDVPEMMLEDDNDSNQTSTLEITARLQVTGDTTEPEDTYYDDSTTATTSRQSSMTFCQETMAATATPPGQEASSHPTCHDISAQENEGPTTARAAPNQDIAEFFNSVRTSSQQPSPTDNLEDPATRKPCEKSSSTPNLAMDFDVSLDKSTITSMTMGDVEYLLGKLESLLYEATNHRAEVTSLKDIINDTKKKLTREPSIKDQVRQLQQQNSVLKEKSVEARKENDLLVDKIQKLHTRLSLDKQIRVSVGEMEDTETDETFFIVSTQPSPDTDKPLPLQTAVTPQKPGKAKLTERSQSYTTGSASYSISSSLQQEILRNEEKRMEEASEKIMRLEQRIICLQNANNLNSCATCRPLRQHVMKIERQLISLVQERKAQLEELFQLKQEACSSAVSEKDAHIAWLEVTGEGNVHTQNSIDKLRRERREILNRMKDDNENRMKLVARLEETPALFTGPAKLSAIGELGNEYVSEIDYDEEDERLPFPLSTGDLEDIHINPIFFISPSPLPPALQSTSPLPSPATPLPTLPSPFLTSHLSQDDEEED